MTPTPMITSGVKKRRPLSIQQKIQIIDLLNEGAGLMAVSKDFELHPDHVRKIRSKSVSYREKYNLLPNKSKARIKKTQWLELEQELYKWCLQKQALREQFGDKMILAQAVEMSTAMTGLPPFRASRGWLAKFKRRYLVPSLGQQLRTLRTLDEAQEPEQAEEKQVEEEKIEEEKIEGDASVIRNRTPIVYDWERCRENEAEGFPFRMMSPVPSTPEKKCKKTLSLEQKINVAKLLDQGENVEDVAEKFDVRQGYVRKIQRNAAILREKYRKSTDNSRSRKTESKWAEVEKKLYVWWLEKHASDEYITNQKMTTQALKIHAELGGTHPRGYQFRASKDWLNKFKRRYQVPPRSQQTEEGEEHALLQQEKEEEEQQQQQQQEEEEEEEEQQQQQQQQQQQDPEVSSQREGRSRWGGRRHTPIVYDLQVRGDHPASRPSGRETSSAHEARGGTPAGSALNSGQGVTPTKEERELEWRLNELIRRNDIMEREMALKLKHDQEMTLAARYDEPHDSSMCTDTACLQYCRLESSRVSLSPKHDSGALELVKQKLDELERKIFRVEFALDAKIFSDSQKEESTKQHEENKPPEVVVCEDDQELLAASFRRVRRWTKKQDRSIYLQFKPIYKLFKNEGLNE